MLNVKDVVTKIDLDLLLERAGDWVKRVGRTSIRPVLSLYYVMKSPETPLSDKLLIVSVLSYLILPVNILSVKQWSLLGYADEIAAIMIAYKRMRKYITPEIESKVDNILEKWFPELKYELIP